MKDIILLGLGGHAHSVVDSIEQTGNYNIVGFLDTQEMQGKRYRDYCVLDTDDALQKYFDSGVKNAFVTIGFMGYGMVRNQLYQRLKDIGYSIPNVIDHTAVISENVKLEEGIFVGKKAVINANVVIEKMCIVNTAAIIEHDCVIKEFSHVAVGSVLCGGVSVGKQTFIGANATIIQNIKIGRNVIVGAGATVRIDVEDNKMYVKQRMTNYTGGGYKVIIQKVCVL